VRPLGLAATSGPTWGPRPTCHATDAPVAGCEKTAPPLAPMPRLLGAVTEVWKGKFFRTGAATRGAPAHGPIVTLSAMVMGQSAVGIGVPVGMAIGGPAVMASTGAQEQQSNRQSNSGPTCRLASSTEAGPGPLSVP
jgi:hypothetical protein